MINEEKDMVIPKHVGIILDGNRRWAKAKGLPKLQGYKSGYATIRDLAPYVFDRGVEVLSVYAFSEENFNRSPEEVKYLMDIFVDVFKKESKEFHDEDIKVVFSGRTNRLRDDVKEAMDKITEITKNNKRGIFNICLGYGGQQEIVDTTKKICQMYKDEVISLDDIDTNLVRKNLYQDLPLVDLLIRTSGEYRISNFMMYQCSYAEFYFSKVNFPDFNKEEFDKALLEFNERQRRFGV